MYTTGEDYEQEMIDAFFDHTRLLEANDFPHFIDFIFEFIRQNDENYRLLCKSNDFLFAARKLNAIALDKLIELCYHDARINNHTLIELDLTIFLEGLFCEYVKYCRGLSSNTLDDLYDYTKQWTANFLLRRSSEQK